MSAISQSLPVPFRGHRGRNPKRVINAHEIIVHEVQVHHVSVDFGLLGERIGARASCAGYDPKQTKETGRGDSMEAHSHRDK